EDCDSIAPILGFDEAVDFANPASQRRGNMGYRLLADRTATTAFAIIVHSRLGLLANPTTHNGKRGWASVLVHILAGICRALFNHSVRLRRRPRNEKRCMTPDLCRSG